MARLAVRPPGDVGGRTAAWWPWLLVAAAVCWNLVSLRALTLGVPYLNDSSLHEQMVRFATAQLRAGHLPLTSWFPFLGEGSPQFLHYQSLPAILTGAVGLLTGPDVAFRWSLYLLLSLWPISVYVSARAFGAGRPAAAASAAMAPFLVSATGVGYEQHAYVWTGFGVWTQLWASWTLPLAWGFELASDPRRARLPQSGAAHRAHRRAALRDRLPGALGAARLAARRRQAARGPVAAGRGPPRRLAARVGVGDRPASGAAGVGGSQRGAAGHRTRQRLRRASGARLAGLGAAARPRPAAGRHRVRGARVRTGMACLVLGRRRPRPAGRARGVPAVRVRSHDVRVARRSDPGQRRPLLPPLHDGRAARRAAARRSRSGVAGGRLRPAARKPESRAGRPACPWPPCSLRRSPCSRPRGFSSAPTTATTAPRSRPSAARTTPRAPSSIASSR